MVVTALHMRTSTNGRSRKWKQSWRMRRSVEDRCARKWRVFHRRIADKLHRRRPRPTSNWRSTSIIWQPCVRSNPGPDSFQLDLKSCLSHWFYFITSVLFWGGHSRFFSGGGQNLPGNYHVGTSRINFIMITYEGSGFWDTAYNHYHWPAYT